MPQNKYLQLLTKYIWSDVKQCILFMGSSNIFLLSLKIFIIIPTCVLTVFKLFSCNSHHNFRTQCAEIHKLCEVVCDGEDIVVPADECCQPTWFIRVLFLLAFLLINRLLIAPFLLVVATRFDHHNQQRLSVWPTPWC